MKKQIFILSAVLVSSLSLFAQKSNVSRASNLLYQEPIDYVKATEFIEQAKNNEETAKQAKTWYIAGRIGYSKAYNEMKKTYLNQTVEANALYDGLETMYTNYMVANQYDSVVNKKGKVKYKERKKIKADLKEMQTYYIQAGSLMFDIKEFGKAYNMFNTYLKIADSYLFTEKEKSAVKIDSTYNEIKFYAGIAASQASKSEEALKLFNELKQTNFKNNLSVYQNIVTTYQQLGDTVNILASAEEGMAKYPNDQYFIGTIINLYVSQNQLDKAIEYLDKAIAANPTSLMLLNAKGDMLTRTGKFDDAVKAIEAALAVNPKDPTALYNMGFCNASQADAVLDAAYSINDNAKYKAEVAKADKLFLSAVANFEMAYEVMPKNDGNYFYLLQNLKGLYYRLKSKNADMQPKYEKVDAELKAL